MELSVIGHNVGGLGNQLFITAATIAYGLRHHMNPKISDYWSYPTTAGCVGREQSPIIRDACQNFICNVNDIKDVVDYKEPHWHYSEIPKFNCNVRLNGYFQSEQYFSDYEEVIKNIFYPKPFQLNKIKNQSLLSIDNRRKIAVHIRRTDYLNLSFLHHLLPLSYYIHAINYLNNKHNNNTFLFFSDDKQFVKDTFINGIVIEDTDDNEFNLMTQCDDFIIANSTFSWWGAWLSKTIDKTVICPAKWFAQHGPKKWDSIYCKNWVVMNDNGNYDIK